MAAVFPGRKHRPANSARWSCFVTTDCSSSQRSSRSMCRASGFPADGAQRPGDVVADVDRPGNGDGGRDRQQDLQPQHRQGIAGAPQRQPQCSLAVHTERDAATHHLRQLLGKPGWHLRRMCVNDVTPVIALDGCARVGDDIGGFYQAVDLVVVELQIIGVNVANKAADGGGDLAASPLPRRCCGWPGCRPCCGRRSSWIAAGRSDHP